MCKLIDRHVNSILLFITIPPPPKRRMMGEEGGREEGREGGREGEVTCSFNGSFGHVLIPY